MRSMLLVLLAGAGVLAPAASAAAPVGATAVCRDGTYSYSRHHSGTCSYHGGVATWLDGISAAAPADSASPGTAMVPVGQTVLLGPRTRASGCARGVEPDRRCSPGAYSSALTSRVICSAGFRTSAIRNVPQSEKFSVEKEYGMPARLYGRTIEVDHIVSLEIGGSNDIANLYPEPGSGPANYRVKDKLENKLHALVCAGEMTLRAAQSGIALDWVGLYRRVFGIPATLASLHASGDDRLEIRAEREFASTNVPYKALAHAIDVSAAVRVP